jgi:hypothetical protein
MILITNVDKSFGLRQKFRSRENLFEYVNAYIREQKTLAGQLKGSLCEPITPKIFFTLSTATFTRWAAWNLNRLCVGFESVYELASGRVVSWEQTRVMIMFLRGIPCFLGHGTAGQHARFWRHRYPPRGDAPASARPHSLGFLDNMRRHGYAWFADKIDWQTMTFAPRYAARLGFDQSEGEGRFRRGAVLRSFKDHLLRIQHAEPHLLRWAYRLWCRRPLTRYLHQICAHVFRVNVWTSLRGALKAAYVENAVAGDLPLCWEALSDATEGVTFSRTAAH